MMSDWATQWSEVPLIYPQGSQKDQWTLHFSVTKEPKSACGTLKEKRAWEGVEGGVWEGVERNGR